MDSETSLSFNSSVSGLEIEDPPSDDLLPAAPPKKKRARGMIVGRGKYTFGL